MEEFIRSTSTHLKNGEHEKLLHLLKNNTKLLEDNKSEPEMGDVLHSVLERGSDRVKMLWATSFGVPYKDIRMAHVLDYCLASDVTSHVLSETAAKVGKILFIICFLCQQTAGMEMKNGVLSYTGIETGAECFVETLNENPLEILTKTLNEMEFDDLYQPKNEWEICHDYQKQMMSGEPGDFMVTGVKEDFYLMFEFRGKCKYTFTPKVMEKMEVSASRLEASLILDRKESNIIPSLNGQTMQDNCYHHGNAAIQSQDKSFYPVSRSRVFGCQQRCLEDRNCNAWSFNLLSNRCSQLNRSNVTLNPGVAISCARECRIQTGLGTPPLPQGCSYMDVDEKQLLYKCPGEAERLKAVTSEIIDWVTLSQEQSALQNFSGLSNGTVLLNENDVFHMKKLLTSTFQFDMVSKLLLQIPTNMEKRFKNVFTEYEKYRTLCGDEYLCFANKTGSYRIMLKMKKIKTEVEMNVNSWTRSCCYEGECDVTSVRFDNVREGIHLTFAELWPEAERMTLCVSQLSGRVEISSQQTQEFYHPRNEKMLFVINDCSSFLINNISAREGSKQQFLKCQNKNQIFWLGGKSTDNDKGFFAVYNTENDLVQYLFILFFGVLIIANRCWQRVIKKQVTGLLDTTNSSWSPQPRAGERDIMMIPSRTNDINLRM